MLLVEVEVTLCNFMRNDSQIAAMSKRLPMVYKTVALKKFLPGGTASKSKIQIWMEFHFCGTLVDFTLNWF